MEQIRHDQVDEVNEVEEVEERSEAVGQEGVGTQNPEIARNQVSNELNDLIDRFARNWDEMLVVEGLD